MAGFGHGDLTEQGATAVTVWLAEATVPFEARDVCLGFKVRSEWV